MSTHLVDASFTGGVFEVHLSLERQRFLLRRDPTSGAFVGHADAFDIPGELRITLEGKAMNGTQWTLSITVDDHGPFSKQGTAHGGAFGFDEVSVRLPLKDK